MNLETKSIAFELKSIGETTPDVAATFEGIGACFFNLDWKGDIIDPAAFEADLPFFKSSGKVRNEHGITTGRVADASTSAAGLFVKGQILPTTAGLDQAILVKGKAITNLSIGYMTLARDWLNSPDAVRAYWDTKGYAASDDDLVALGQFGAARLLTRVRVYEVSTTFMATNDKTPILSVKGSDPRPGRSLSDHSEAVLATVAEYLDRVEAMATIRHADGRAVSTETKARVSQLESRITAWLASLETKRVARDGPAPTFDQLYAESLATFARLDGALD